MVRYRKEEGGKEEKAVLSGKLQEVDCYSYIIASALGPPIIDIRIILVVISLRSALMKLARSEIRDSFDDEWRHHGSSVCAILAVICTTTEQRS